jgi:hypothetical protein
LAVCRARAPSHFFHECHVSPRSSCFSYQQLPLWLVVVVLSLSSRHPVPRIASCVCGGSRNLGQESFNRMSPIQVSGFLQSSLRV